MPGRRPNDLPRRDRPRELWIVEPTDGNPTQAFADREGTGAYLAALSGPFALSHWVRVLNGPLGYGWQKRPS